MGTSVKVSSEPKKTWSRRGSDFKMKKFNEGLFEPNIYFHLSFKRRFNPWTTDMAPVSRIMGYELSFFLSLRALTCNMTTFSEFYQSGFFGIQDH